MIIETSRGSDFTGLHRYLTEDRDHDIVFTREVTSAAVAAHEMAIVAGERPSVRKPVLHLSISFDPEEGDKVTDDLALELLAEVEEELGLQEHQCLAARHNDTPHKHYHFSLNAVHPFTFETPPDRPNRALLDPDFKRRPARKRPPRPLSWDAFMLPRLAAICDRFATKHGLRRVKQPLGPSAKDKLDASPRVAAGALRREERTGIMPLLEQQEAMRIALDATNWEERQIALGILGIRLEAAEVPVKGGGSRIRGIRLVALGDLRNAIKASSLGAAYGLAALDRSISHGSQMFSDWWRYEKARPSARASTECAGSSHQTYLDAFRRYEREHAAGRTAATEKRKWLKEKHRKERNQLTQTIRVERDQALANVPKSFRRLARAAFQKRVAEPRRRQLALEQRAQLVELRVPPKMQWVTWLRDRSRSGDDLARELLLEMEARHRRHAHRSKASTGGVIEIAKADASGLKLEDEAPPEADASARIGISDATFDPQTSSPTLLHLPSAEDAGREFDDALSQLFYLKGKGGKGGAGR